MATKRGRLPLMHYGNVLRRGEMHLCVKFKPSGVRAEIEWGLSDPPTETWWNKSEPEWVDAAKWLAALPVS